MTKVTRRVLRILPPSVALLVMASETMAQGTTAQETTTTTLPDPAKLVSFSPIVDLEWTSPDILYLQTGYVKEYKNAADSRRSYLRWHRLVFSPQPQTPAR